LRRNFRRPYLRRRTERAEAPLLTITSTLARGQLFDRTLPAAVIEASEVTSSLQLVEPTRRFLRELCERADLRPFAITL